MFIFVTEVWDSLNCGKPGGYSFIPRVNVDTLVRCVCPRSLWPQGREQSSPQQSPSPALHMRALQWHGSMLGADTLLLRLAFVLGWMESAHGRKSQHFTLVNGVPAKRGEKFISVHASCQAWGQLHHLIQLKTISHPLSEGSRPWVTGLLALQGGRRADRDEDGGQGHGGPYFSLTQLFYIAVVLQVGTPSSESRGKHGGSWQKL